MGTGWPWWGRDAHDKDREPMVGSGYSWQGLGTHGGDGTPMVRAGHPRLGRGVRNGGGTGHAGDRVPMAGTRCPLVGTRCPSAGTRRPWQGWDARGRDLLPLGDGSEPTWGQRSWRASRWLWWLEGGLAGLALRRAAGAAQGRVGDWRGAAVGCFGQQRWALWGEVEVKDGQGTGTTGDTMGCQRLT